MQEGQSACNVVGDTQPPVPLQRRLPVGALQALVQRAPGAQLHDQAALRAIGGEGQQLADIWVLHAAK